MDHSKGVTVVTFLQIYLKLGRKWADVRRLPPLDCILNSSMPLFPFV
jgi:hypothetical protein